MRAHQFTIGILDITTASIDLEHSSRYAFAVGAEATNAFHMPVVSGAAHTRANKDYKPHVLRVGVSQVAGVQANWRCCDSNISAEYYMRMRPMWVRLPLSEPVSESVCSNADRDPFDKVSADFVKCES